MLLTLLRGKLLDIRLSLVALLWKLLLLPLLVVALRVTGVLFFVGGMELCNVGDGRSTRSWEDKGKLDGNGVPPVDLSLRRRGLLFVVGGLATCRDFWGVCGDGCSMTMAEFEEGIVDGKDGR